MTRVSGGHLTAATLMSRPTSRSGRTPGDRGLHPEFVPYYRDLAIAGRQRVRTSKRSVDASREFAVDLNDVLKRSRAEVLEDAYEVLEAAHAAHYEAAGEPLTRQRLADL